MPVPRDDETREEFVDRFMDSEEAKRDYPDQDQRFAVAVSTWEDRRKKAEKAKTFKAPEQARENARKVLRWREKHGDDVKGMTRVGWERANQLANNENLSLDTVQRMAQFARHEQHKEVSEEHKDAPWRDAGHVAWLGWGGDAGINWARRVSERETDKALDRTNAQGTVGTMTQIEKSCEVLKTDDEQRLVYGWAWVNSVDGELVFDEQDQGIETGELQKAAHAFMLEVRKAGSVHMRDPETGEKIKKGEVVESMVFTPELQKALGIDLGKTGWFIVSKVSDDEQWQKIKALDHISFSIGGRAKAVPFQE